MTLQYSERHDCPKCGSGLVQTKYDEAQDVLQRRCIRCEYVWSEKPLDAKSEAPGAPA